MAQKFSEQFVRTAHLLGYTQNDIYPISLEQLEIECSVLTKKMPTKEKEFYLHKKLIIIQAKRQKILKQVKKNLAFFREKQQKRQKFNPKLRQIFSEHERRIKKTERYNQIRSRGLQTSGLTGRDKKISNTIDFRRDSPSVRSSYSKTSQSSRKSINSQASNRSGKMSSSINSLTHSKLIEVRKKQKQVQQYKKIMLQQKLRQDKMKFLRSQQNVLAKSRKIKTRSQISQKIVNQNRQEMDSIRKFGTINRFENLKFKINRNQLSRESKIKSLAFSANKDLDLYYVSQVNRQIQKNKLHLNKTRYEQKFKQSSNWQAHYTSLKKNALSFMQQGNQIRAKLAEERKSLQLREEKKFKQRILHYENRKLNQAEKRRQQQRQKRRLNGASQQIKRQIVSQNKKTILTSQSMRAKVQLQNFSQKIKQIQQLETLKKKLQKGYLSVNKKIDRSLLDGRNQIVSIRQSFAQGKRPNPIFNTIFP